MAVSARGSAAAGVIAHSDHGRSTRASSTAPTPSSPASTSRWDRSATLGQRRRRELLRQPRERTPPPRAVRDREQARLRVFWYIECFYNPRRRHPASACSARSTTNSNTNRRPSRPNLRVNGNGELQITNLWAAYLPRVAARTSTSASPAAASCNHPTGGSDATVASPTPPRSATWDATSLARIIPNELMHNFACL